MIMFVLKMFVEGFKIVVNCDHLCDYSSINANDSIILMLIHFSRGRVRRNRSSFVHSVDNGSLPRGKAFPPREYQVS